MAEIIYYIDTNNNYYINNDNDYYVFRTSEVPLKTYLYINNEFKKVKPIIFNSNLEYIKYKAIKY